MSHVPIIVAVNASPLIGLVKGGRLSLLGVLYDEVIIPLSVYDDVVVKGHGRPGAKAVHNAIKAGWIKVVPMMAKGFGIFDYEVLLRELGELP